jgi:hypothetical protein
MTPSGIEPATFRFVAQHLNHCATAVPKRREANRIGHVLRRYCIVKHVTEGNVKGKIAEMGRPERKHRYQLHRRLVGPQSPSGLFGEEKNLFLIQEF